MMYKSSSDPLPMNAGFQRQVTSIRDRDLSKVGDEGGPHSLCTAGQLLQQLQRYCHHLQPTKWPLLFNDSFPHLSTEELHDAHSTMQIGHCSEFVIMGECKIGSCHEVEASRLALSILNNIKRTIRKSR